MSAPAPNLLRDALANAAAIEVARSIQRIGTSSLVALTRCIEDELKRRQPPPPRRVENGAQKGQS